MPVNKLLTFLDENRIKYITIDHSTAYTAQEIAGAAHIPGRQLAKTVMVKLDGEMAMAVVSAVSRLDLERLREAAGADSIELASEQDFKGSFPDCEPGAMPPFGNLYDMRVFVAGDLPEDEDFAFNAGSHTRLIRMPYRDFERLVEPRKAAFIQG